MNQDDFQQLLVSHGNVGDAVTAAADLGRRDAERTPDAYDLDSGTHLVVGRLRNDEHFDVQSLERHLPAPLLPRGTAIVHDPMDFCAYVTRLADERTTLWADLEAGRVVAVLDDHLDSEDAGWRQHTVQLALPRDPDWAAWIDRDNKLSEQTVFAEHIEQMTHTIVEPTAADMLEMITSFHARRHVTFRQEVNITSGDVQLTYDEETKTSAKPGHIEVPRTFRVRISPWLTVDPVEVTARLRYRIQNGSLTIGYSLLRPDRAQQEAFDGVLLTLKEHIERPLHLGLPPKPVAPQS